MVAHSTGFVKEGCILSHFDLIDYEGAEILRNKTTLKIHRLLWKKNQCLTFGGPLPDSYFVDVHKDEEKRHMSLKFHFFGIPTPETIITAFYDTLDILNVSAIIQRVKHVATLYMREPSLLRSLFGCLEGRIQPLSDCIVFNFPVLHMWPRLHLHLGHNNIKVYTDNCLKVVRDAIFQNRRPLNDTGLQYTYTDLNPEDILCPCSVFDCPGFANTNELCFHISNPKNVNKI